MGGEKCVKVKSVHAKRMKSIGQMMKSVSVNFQLELSCMFNNNQTSSLFFFFKKTREEKRVNWHVSVSYRVKLGHV